MEGGWRRTYVKIRGSENLGQTMPWAQREGRMKRKSTCKFQYPACCHMLTCVPEVFFPCIYVLLIYKYQIILDILFLLLWQIYFT